MSDALAKVVFDNSEVPLWTPELVTSFVEAAYKSGSLSCFAFIRRGKKEQHNNGCFGAMHGYQITDDVGWGVALKYASMRDFEGTPTDYELWYTKNFLLNRKYSPWRALLKHMVIVHNQNGVPVAALLKDKDKVANIDKGLLQNFNIASRQPMDRSDMVRSIHTLYQSGFVNKREAVLLRGRFSVNPITGVVMVDPSAPFYNDFIASNHYLRFLDGNPNSSMHLGKKEGRHLPINQNMASSNDAYVWGADSRPMKAINDFLSKKIPSKTVKSFFGAEIEITELKDVKTWIEGFREVYQAALKTPPKGQSGTIEYDEEDDRYEEEDEDEF